jgi:hypothetical protein
MAYDRTAPLFDWRDLEGPLSILEMLRPQQFRFMRIAISPRLPGRRLVECLSVASHWHASQLIVLVLGLSGTIACKLSNVYYYSAAHGEYLVQSTASYTFDPLGFLAIFIISRSRFQPKPWRWEICRKVHTTRGKKTRRDRQGQLNAFG